MSKRQSVGVSCSLVAGLDHDEAGLGSEVVQAQGLVFGTGALGHWL